MKTLFKAVLILFLFGVLVNLFGKYGILVAIVIACLIFLYFHAKKKGHFTDSSAESFVQIHPSSLAGGYYRSYHYDDIKFYPPVEMVSKVNKNLLRPGAEILLKPEPKNKYDNRAIALYVYNYQIGYLLRGTLQDMVHDYMAKKWPIKATLQSLNLIDGEYQGYITLSFYRKTEANQQNIKRLGYSDIDVHTIHPTNPDERPATPLTGKNIVFSGYFTIPIDEMMQMAVDVGATLKSRVSRNTQYLVVGEQSQSYVDENGMSSKEATATRLIEEGVASIKILSEKEFFELIN